MCKSRDRVSRDWAMTQSNLGHAIQLLRERVVNRTGFLGQRCRQPEFDRTGGTSDVAIGGRMVSLDFQLFQLTILSRPHLPRDGRLVVE